MSLRIERGDKLARTLQNGLVEDLPATAPLGAFCLDNRRRSPQSFGTDLLPGLDPPRCRIALFWRAVQGESRNHSLLEEPPHAEAAGRQVSPLHDFVRSGRIAPELVGQVEHVGKEIRDMDEGRAIAQKRSRAVLSLRNSVVPVLHAPPLPEQRVHIAGYVTGRVDIRVAGLKVLICHQAIGHAFGGRVKRAEKIMHGKTSEIHHDNKTIFRGLPKPFTATRYHSLIVERSTLPSCLIISAETTDGTIMGLRHREFLVEGVQFHPESVLTPSGLDLLKNFLSL